MELIDNKLHIETSQGPKEITIDPNDFSINEADVEGELCRAGVLLCYYADLAAELEAKASNLKNRLREAEAVAAIVLRNSSSGPKITQGMVDDHLYTNVEVIAIRSSLVNAQKEATKTQSLFKSANQKVECLKALAYRQNKQEKLF